jgi:hypothetical protein
MLASGLVMAAAMLSGCSDPANCYGGDYRGGCIAGAVPTTAPAPAAAATGAPVSAVTVPPPPSARPTGPAAAAVPYGDPAAFADVDDKQCRSYGLTFGSHDYADCRIRLSAQHRGLDPDAGATPGH